MTCRRAGGRRARDRGLLPRPRGLTLIELLASLALLCLITVASAGFVHGVLLASAASTETLQWNQAAGAVLDSIGDDLVAGDFDPVGDRARDDPRVTVTQSLQGSALEIRSRSASLGPCVRRYAVEGGRLVIGTRPARDQRAQSIRGPVSAPALGHVTGFDAGVDPPRRILWVKIIGESSRAAARTFAFPPEESP